MQSVYKMKFFQSSLSLSLTYITLIQHTLLRTCKNAALASEAKIKAKNQTMLFCLSGRKKAYKQTKNEEITCSRGILEILSCVLPCEVLSDGGSLSKPLACSINAENSSPLPIRKKSFKIYDQNKNYYAYCFSKF